MPRVNRVFLMLVFILTAIPLVQLFAWIGVGDVAPMIQQVAPAAARAGEVVTATGFQLDSKHVEELYLYDRDVHYRAEILAQTAGEIRFRVPANAPSRDLYIAIKRTGQTGLLEQPVYLKILEPAG